MRLSTIKKSIENRQKIIDKVSILLRENKAVLPVHSTNSGLGPGILFKEIKEALASEKKLVEKYEQGVLDVRGLWMIQYYGCTKIKAGLIFHKKRNLIDENVMSQVINLMKEFKAALNPCYTGIDYFKERLEKIGKPYWW